MRILQHRQTSFSSINLILVNAALFAATSLLVAPAYALIHDGQANTQHWFDPVNWNTNSNANLLIPGATNDTMMANDPEAEPDEDDYVGIDVSEATINYRPGQNDPGAWDEDGEGVVYDPTNDPHFAAAASLQYAPSGSSGRVYDRDTIWRILLANNTADDATDNGGPITGTAKLTLRGNIDFHNHNPADPLGTIDSRVWIGRSSGVPNVAGNGLVVQESGNFINPFGDVSLGEIQTNIGPPGGGEQGAFGNGTWDYRAGTFQAGLGLSGTGAGTRVRVSSGGSSGIGGVGKFIMHNPGNGAGGHVRVNNMELAGFGGESGFQPNGVDKGVAIVEFHYENGGTRAIQVNRDLVIANGVDAVDTGVRSTRLKLVLNEAPIIDVEGRPNDLALFDLDSEGNGTGNIVGPRGLQGGPSTFGLRFSNADLAAINPLDASAVYQNGGIVEAMFGSSTYRWNIYYDGKIHWSNRDSSALDLTMGGGDGIEGTVGGGKDIVLIGLDSIIVEGLPGDYNEDDVVDAADYTVWRNNFGGSLTLPGADPDAMTPNMVDEEDYAWWKQHYGTSAPGGGGLSSSVVPEPSSVLLALLASSAVFGFGRRNRTAA